MRTHLHLYNFINFQITGNPIENIYIKGEPKENLLPVEYWDLNFDKISVFTRDKITVHSGGYEIDFNFQKRIVIVESTYGYTKFKNPHITSLFLDKNRINTWEHLWDTFIEYLIKEIEIQKELKGVK